VLNSAVCTGILLAELQRHGESRRRAQPARGENNARIGVRSASEGIPHREQHVRKPSPRVPNRGL
jgi:hypothetical protein